MFWDSVWLGLLTLAHWQVWAAIVFYELVYFAFLMFVGAASGDKESGGRMAAGCLTFMIGGPILQGVLMGLLVIFLMPIMLGGDTTTPISVIVQSFGGIALAGIIAIVVAILATFIPILGDFISESVGIMTFIIGLVIFRIVSNDAVNDILTKAGHTSATVYPSFWLSIAYLLIASVLVQGTIWALAYVFTHTNIRSEGSIAFIAPMLGILAGLIPLFMYTQYVALSIRTVLAQ